MHVHANAAMSVDGKLATRRRQQIAISGPNDFDRVDRLRAEVDAVLVGVGTVLADDPSLTIPSELVDDRMPARVVLDSRARTPTDARVLSDDVPTYIVVSEAAPPDSRASLVDSGATILETPGTERVDVARALTQLGSAGIERLLVEGGGEVLYSMFEAEAVDTLSVYIASSVIGGHDAPTLVDGDGFVDRFPSLELEDVTRIDDGLLCEYTVVGWRDVPSG